MLPPIPSRAESHPFAAHFRIALLLVVAAVGAWKLQPATFWNPAI
jgi:hypothetical protein